MVCIVAALGALLAMPALAADQGVAVDSNFFAPTKVAVKPGESVTWTRAGSGNPHNVNFEDGAFTNPSPPSSGSFTVTRTFAAEGTYLYHCQIHGGTGGFGMSGVVYVNAAGVLPPVGAFTVSPIPALVGQSVSFNGAGSSATEGSILKYEWDLDGNGSFETDTATTPTASRSYASPASLAIKLRVTDNRGETDQTTRSLEVTAPPTASFTVSPNPAQTGQRVSFSGAGSSDSDGSIVKYEWDRDGNGSFEIFTQGPATSLTYAIPETLSVKLRVTDDDGATAETALPLKIDPASQPQPPLPPQPQPLLTQPPPLPTPQPPSNPARRPGQCSKLSGRKRTACIKKRCGRLKGKKKRACVKKVTRRR